MRGDGSNKKSEKKQKRKQKQKKKKTYIAVNILKKGGDSEKKKLGKKIEQN